MKKLLLLLVVISLAGSIGNSVFAEDTAAEIASLQAQIERLKSMVNIASEEVDKTNNQNLQSLEGQVRSWQSQLANIDSQIARLDQQIASASDQLKAVLIQSLGGMLRQKATADAALVRLRLKIDDETKRHAEEKSILFGDYNKNIDTLNAQLEQLVQIDCCIDGSCEKKTAPECAAAGGRKVSDCASECAK